MMQECKDIRNACCRFNVFNITICKNTEVVSWTRWRHMIDTDVSRLFKMHF